MDKHQEAIQDFTRSLELNNRHSESYNVRGNCYCSLMEYNAAVVDYSKAIELRSTEPTFYKNRANAYCKLNQHNQEFGDLSFVLGELKVKCASSYQRRSQLNVLFYKL